MSLVFALAASILMHAAVILLPYLGSNYRAAYSPSEIQRSNPRVTVIILTAAKSSPTPLQASAGGDAGDSPAKTPAPQESPVPAATAGAHLLPLPGPTYYETNQLTKHPQPEFLAELETPETKSIVASGRMILRLSISDQGAVAEATIEQTDLPQELSRAAVAAFRQSRFLPGELNGRRVGSIMRIEVSYDDGRSPAQ